ncbi:MAG: LytR/AlgR family response regulator transcription factor [Bacteroidales bacterium]
MNLKCIVVDDEPLALEILEDYIDKIPYLQNMGSFSSSIAALQFLKSNTVDFILLDIQMPELTGFQMLGILDNPPLVIFTTAYDQYAIESYELEAVDYLLKPFDLGRFLKAVEKVWKRKENIFAPQVAAGENIPAKESFIFIKTDHRIQRIMKSDILYIEGMKNYLRIASSTGKYMTLMSFKDIQEMLPDSQFVRVHKSFIVALDKIDCIERSRIKIGSTYIPIGDSYKKEIERIVN